MADRENPQAPEGSGTLPSELGDGRWAYGQPGPTCYGASETVLAKALQQLFFSDPSASRRPGVVAISGQREEIPQKDQRREKPWVLSAFRELTDVLADILNTSPSQAVVPTCHHHHHRRSRHHYRLVPLTPIIMKCFKQLVVHHMKSTPPPNPHWTPTQFVFWSNRLTTTYT